MKQVSSIFKIKLIYLIKGLIVVFYIMAAYYGIRGILEFQGANIGDPFNFDTRTFYSALFQTKWLRPIILLTIPMVGIFINNKTGWLLINMYFYSIAVGVLFTIFESKFSSFLDILTNIIFFTLVVSIIGVMNMGRIFEKYYGQSGKNRFTQNTIALIFGIGILFILRYS